MAVAPLRHISDSELKLIPAHFSRTHTAPRPVHPRALHEASLSGTGWRWPRTGATRTPNARRLKLHRPGATDGVTGLFGRSAATIDGTITAGIGGLAATRMGSIGDSITSVGDLYPMMTLKWNSGVHNFMTYATGDIPVGAYDPSRLANLGIGHGAIDGVAVIRPSVSAVARSEASVKRRIVVVPPRTV